MSQSSLAVFSLSLHRFSRSAVQNNGLFVIQGEGPGIYCFSYKERLNNRREMTVLCSSASVFMQDYPIEMHGGILGFGESPTALWNWAALVSGTKSEVVSVLCHWCSPQLSLDSCGLPPTVLWGWLFLNKWVYDSDFLLPLLSLSLIWNSTHPSERAQSSCCLSLHFTCATWWRGGSVSAPYEKPVATPRFLPGPGSLFRFSVRVIALS